MQTACQQTCPTQAITFGNRKDGNALVAKLSHSPRAYHVLHELGTLPGVSYLKKVVRAEPAGGNRKAGH
jgi:molybdopterin-containing oxidoreductase family iron-sulfur binding subunit